MMKKSIVFLTLALVGIFVSCGDNQHSGLSKVQQDNYLSMGSTIANAAQKVLLANVSGAIESKGVPGAVDYCNLNAIHLTDSLAEPLAALSIERKSDKNRNPNNAIQSAVDKEAWESLKALMQDDEVKEKHLVLAENDDIYYYKSIPLGMQTCLSCHGSTDGDISEETLKVINEKYPEDKAIGYQMAELRGMWKIKMKKDE